MRFRDKTAVLTGASKGIGRAAAVQFASEGANVAIFDRDVEPGEEAAAACREHGTEAVCIPVELSREADIEGAVRTTLDRWGRIDVLVNNAGVYFKGDVTETSREQWDELMAVNVTGAFLCAKQVVPGMIAAGGGTVINVASEAGLVGIAGQAAYNVSKAALISLTQSMAVDFAAKGVRVNCVCPGTTLTPLVEQAVAREADPGAALERLAGMRPLNRLGRPEEIAEAIVFLASDACAYATGAVLAADGGYTAQ